MSANPLLGQLKVFGFTFNPRGWSKCQGQILPRSSNTALFSLLGTAFGGDGRTSFALPDARGRRLIGTGQGPGLPNVALGQRGGSEWHTLTLSELPVHNHTYNQQVAASSESGDMDSPSGAFIGSHDGAFNEDSNGERNLQTSNTGIAQPINILDPYLGMNVCIAIQGTYPSRS